MKTLFLAGLALGMLAAGPALAGGNSSSHGVSTTVIGPAVSRELATQTIKQVSGAAAEATRASGGVASDADQ